MPCRGKSSRRRILPDGLHVATIYSRQRQARRATAIRRNTVCAGLPKARTTTRCRGRVRRRRYVDAKAQVLDLPGNLVPEAFSSNGRHAVRVGLRARGCPRSL